MSDSCEAGQSASFAGQAEGIVCTLKQTVDLQQDYFSVFGLQPACDIDLSELQTRYRRLQQVVHPDKFLRECDRSQRLAQQQAALVNEAYQTLRSPLLRAQYLLSMVGEQRQQEETTRDTGFLMKQIELREQLEQVAQDLQGLDELHRQVSTTEQEYLAGFARAWHDQDWTAARSQLDRLQFASKLILEIEEHQARLLDA